MTNEEIAREAAKEHYHSFGLPPKYSEHGWINGLFPIILAAINRAQSEDKARLDWLEKENPYLWVNTFQGQTWRDKIDAARKHEA